VVYQNWEIVYRSVYLGWMPYFLWGAPAASAARQIKLYAKKSFNGKAGNPIKDRILFKVGALSASKAARGRASAAFAPFAHSNAAVS
jgi:hypothetical protein